MQIALKALLVTHLVLSRGPADQVFKPLSASDGALELAAIIGRAELPANIRLYAGFLEERLKMFARFELDMIKSKSEKAYDAKAAKRMATLTIEEGVTDETEALQVLLDKLVDAISALRLEMRDKTELSDLQLRYLYHDLFKLVEAIGEGILNQLQRFFTLVQKDAVRALECYDKHKKVLKTLDKLYEYARSQGQDVVEIKPLPADSLVSSLRDYIHGDGTVIELKRPPPPKRKRTLDIDGYSLSLQISS